MSNNSPPADRRLRVITTAGFPDYALIDSGDGRKLERFGRFTVERPEPQALWRPTLDPGQWLRADATFKSASDAEDDGEGGRWRKNKPCRRRGRFGCSASPRCAGSPASAI